MATSNFTSIAVFGDSLVDSGNDFRAAQAIDAFPFAGLPSGAPTADRGYFEGRFTDGYNFADLVSNKLLSTPTKATFPFGFQDPAFGLTVPFVNRPEGPSLNFAYGGAEATSGVEPAPDLEAQADAYRMVRPADPTGLAIITIGSNDVRALAPKSGAVVTAEAAATELQDVAAEIAKEVGQLFDFGARNILVTGIPDVSLTPSFLGQPDEAARRALASQYAHQLDTLLRADLGALALPAGAHLYTLDFFGLSDQFVADPAAFNFTNVTQSRTSVQQGALSPVGSGFLFFDQIHPSAQAHAIVAAEILDTLATGAGGGEHAVPEQVAPKTLGALTTIGQEKAFNSPLVAGQTYAFDAKGISSGSGALPDPKLRLTGPATDVTDDDGGLGLDAHLSFVAPITGVYTLTLSGVGVSTGSYMLQGADLRGSDVTVLGSTGADTIGAAAGANYLRGGDGNDQITGGSGFDDINGNKGDDTIVGGLGGDWLVGGQGNDLIASTGTGDILQGNLGTDTLNGGLGAEFIHGGQANDLLTGGGGNDWLSGDRGDDTVSGGAGADIFHSFGDAGLDQVLDFNPAEGDRVQLDFGTQYAVAQSAADTVISMTGGGRMILVGVSLGSLTGDWIFGA